MTAASAGTTSASPRRPGELRSRALRLWAASCGSLVTAVTGGSGWCSDGAAPGGRNRGQLALSAAAASFPRYRSPVYNEGMTLESPDACVRLLERRYRRLLRWFPAGHREVHGEEMLGVLLAGSAPGQVRPGFAEAVNLATAGLRVRLRPGGALSDPDGWRDALATFSVSAPLLLLAGTCLSFLTEYAVTSYSPGQGS